ncbi:MAG: hypothetical protein KA781_05250 [Aquabacterium sp.]|jgi:predicted nucleic acid-binding protein|nr:hypothetical protein [Aquabacterium sp.]
MAQRIYISDTNIWIDFGRAGLLDALFALPFTFVSTDFVVNELSHPDPVALRSLGLVVQNLNEVEVQSLFGLMVDHGNSSLADVSCYLVAKAQGHPLLTGDGRLRKQAIKDGLHVHGALWLLDELVANRVINPNQAADALQTMLTEGARLPSQECTHRLAAWRT